MNTERDKFLTEAMGECWHKEIRFIIPEIRAFNALSVCRCGKTTLYSSSFQQDNDFSKWEGFGKLWEWAQKQKWWMNFLGFMPMLGWVREKLIHPDRFANALYEFLKVRNHDKQ